LQVLAIKESLRIALMFDDVVDLELELDLSTDRTRIRLIHTHPQT
jgi:hypothetical protein